MYRLLENGEIVQKGDQRYGKIEEEWINVSQSIGKTYVYETSVPVRRKMEPQEITEILITLEGGVIHNIENIPKDVMVRVMDFDVQELPDPYDLEAIREAELKGLRFTDKQEPYYETIWNV